MKPQGTRRSLGRGCSRRSKPQRRPAADQAQLDRHQPPTRRSLPSGFRLRKRDSNDCLPVRRLYAMRYLWRRNNLRLRDYRNLVDVLRRYVPQLENGLRHFLLMVVLGGMVVSGSQPCHSRKWSFCQCLYPVDCHGEPGVRGLSLTGPLKFINSLTRVYR